MSPSRITDVMWIIKQHIALPVSETVCPLSSNAHSIKHEKSFFDYPILHNSSSTGRLV